MLAHGPEGLAAHALGHPRRERDAATRTRHPQKLRHRPFLVRREDHAEDRQHDVEGVVGEGKGLRVADLEFDLGSFGLGAQPRPRDQ